MKRTILTLSTIALIYILTGGWAHAQNVGINDDGVAPPAGINVEIDFNKAGDATTKTWLLIDGDIITANQTANLTGLDINLSDAALNSTATNIGINVDLSGLTGGTNYAGIFMGGNIGIGTTGPGQKLDVVGNAEINGKVDVISNTDNIFTFDNTDNSWQYMEFKQSGTRKLWMGLDSGTDFRITKENGGDIALMGANVGIGTTSPQASLHTQRAAGSTTPIGIFEHQTDNGLDAAGYLRVFGEGAAYVDIFGDDDNSNPNEGDAGIRFGTNSSTYSTATWTLGLDDSNSDAFQLSNSHLLATNPRLTVTPSGNVGVANTGPTEKLDVTGNIKASGTAYWGSSGTRTETKNDAGALGGRSGYYQTSAPAPAANWPVGAATWWHLLEARHSNLVNNYAMQIAGSFYDQDFWVRKTNNVASTAWAKLITTANVGSYGDNLGNHGATTTLDMNGNDIDFETGNTGMIHSLGEISFDWTAGTYDVPEQHGIQSRNEAGVLSDNIRINSFNDIITTIDGNNNNATSYFKIQHHSTTDGTDLFWVRSADGYAYHSGNVGIGTTSQTSKLTVNSTGAFNQFSLVSPYAAGGWARGADMKFTKLVGTEHRGLTYGLFGSLDVLQGAYFSAVEDDAAPWVASQLFLHASGNVGIGTTTPSAELEVAGWIGRTAHNNGALVGSYNNVAANSAQTNPIYVIGSAYKPATTTLSNMYGIGYSHTNASFITDPGPDTWGMYVAADGDARIWLGASATGVSYFNAGNVGIGTTSPTNKLHVNGKLTTSGTNETSDIRLKKDIEPIENALTKVMKMRGIHYNWRTGEFPDKDLGSDRQIGVIAQEVEKIVPELVETDSEGWKSVQYSNITALLIEAVKEQQKIIEELRADKSKAKKENRELRQSLTTTNLQVEKILQYLEMKSQK